MVETIRIARGADGVAQLVLNRPEKHNALSGEMMDALSAAAAQLGADPGVRVVVLAAEGPTFCAGGDLAWMQAQVSGSRADRAREARRLAGMLGALDALPKPLIGAVHGPAYGGGVGLMAICDAVVTVESARFGLTETRLGLVPATIGPYVTRRLGAATRQVFFSSARFDAAEAVRLGLVTRAVPADVLDEAVAKEVAPYLDCAPAAVAGAKALARDLLGPVTEAEITRSVDALIAAWESGEAQEGIAAFLEKRPAPWQRG